MPDTMGSFRTTVGVESPLRRGTIVTVENVLVDTGSEYTFFPRVVLEQLGIRSERRQRFRIADGSIIERDIGFVITHAGGTTTADDVVFGEQGDIVLLGARSMEGLNVRIDPARKILVDAGPIIAAAAA